ncbi:hypothetical protein ACOTV8_09500, partial [Campylobacter jejuni]
DCKRKITIHSRGLLPPCPNFKKEPDKHKLKGWKNLTEKGKIKMATLFKVEDNSKIILNNTKINIEGSDNIEIAEVSDDSSLKADDLNINIKKHRNKKILNFDWFFSIIKIIKKLFLFW